MGVAAGYVATTTCFGRFFRCFGWGWWFGFAETIGTAVIKLFASGLDRTIVLGFARSAASIGFSGFPRNTFAAFVTLCAARASDTLRSGGFANAVVTQSAFLTVGVFGTFVALHTFAVATCVEPGTIGIRLATLTGGTITCIGIGDTLIARGAGFGGRATGGAYFLAALGSQTTHGLGTIRVRFAGIADLGFWLAFFIFASVSFATVGTVFTSTGVNTFFLDAFLVRCTFAVAVARGITSGGFLFGYVEIAAIGVANACLV